MKGNEHLFEIKKKRSYLGNTDSGRNPNSVLIRRHRKGVFVRQGRGTITSVEEGISIGADKLT